MSSQASSTAPTEPLPVNRQSRLRGPSHRLDTRIHAIRPDLADLCLADRVLAPRYSAGIERRGCRAETPIHAAASAASVVVSTLLYGEAFTTFECAGGWAWGQCGTDGYVGWIPEAVLDAPAVATHRITAPGALVFADASIKSAVRTGLPLNAHITATTVDGDFHALADRQGWVHRAHVAPLTGDIVDLAQAFIGTPYRWGGRSRAGIDCSGLVQAVLLAHGIECPRDSDQQLAALPPIDPATRRRGDIAFFPGHVGLMVDAERILHANAHAMTTLIEPLAAVLDRFPATCTKPLTGVARPPLSRP